MKRSLLFAVLLCAFTDAFSQQLPLFTQYRENAGVINPAAVNHDFLVYEHPLSFGASYRIQWVGLENAPTTQTLRGEYFFADNNSVGILAGGYLINDQTGPTGFTGIYGRIAGVLSEDPRYGGISIGLTTGLVQYRVNSSEIRLREINDVLSGDDQSQLFPDVGFGIFAYQYLDGGIFDDVQVYGGISVPQAFGLNLEFEDEQGRFETQRVQHLYAMAGFYKYFEDDSFLEPSVWFRYVKNTTVSMDFNLRYQMASNFWMGVGGATSGNAHIEAGFIIGENMGLDNTWRIGYGFDYSFTSFGPKIGGTHEINISYSLGD